MPGLGRSTTIGYGKDSVRNTFTAAATKFIKFKEFEVNTKNEYMEDDSATGNRVKLIGREIASQRVEGSLESFLEVDGILGELLLHTFGSVASVTALGATSHTFDTFFNQVETPTFTLQYTKSDIGNKRVRGANIKSIEIDFSDKDCTIKADFMGIAEEAGNSQTVIMTRPTRYLLSKLLISRYAATVAGLDAGQEVKITKLNIKIDNGLEPDPAFGSLNPLDNFAGGSEVEFTFSGVVRNAIWDDFNLLNTKQAYQFDCNMSNLPVLGTSALFPRLRIIIPQASVEVTTQIEKDGFVAFEAVGKGELSFAQGTNIEILLQNTTSTY